ncbi:hypothetical protein [Herbidospora yilanensis]|uniref:hypothetical protein n=1 Tax=Herbidospora yilanensis TaxID=354426 RepID=UPI00078049C8|nr:hypothetical protein [Herbidospora yilanensis]
MVWGFARAGRPGWFVLAAGAVLGWGVLVAFRHAWLADWDLHVATLRAMLDEPPAGGWTPTPYVLGLALLARVSGAGPETVLGAAGILNVLLLLVALRAFGRELGARDSVAALAAVFTIVLWGVSGFGATGFPGLTSLSFSFAFPSTPALALMVLTWTVFVRFRESGRGLVGLVLLPPVILLVHPFAAVATMLGVVGILVARRWQWRRLVLIVPAGVGAIALALAWPYPDVTGVLADSPEFSEVHAPLLEDPHLRYGLALLGVPALLYGVRWRLGRELLIIAALGTGVVGVAAWAGRYEFARFVPVVVLMCHLALARHLGERMTGWRPYAVVTAIGCLAGFVAAMPQMVETLP